MVDPQIRHLETPGFSPQITRICFVGDSFVNGTGDPDSLGWTGRVCAAARRMGHDVTHYNLGVRRDTSADVACWWRAEVVRRLPKDCDGRIVFSFGVNDTTAEDAGTRVPFEQSLENAHGILSDAGRLHSVLMVGPPPVLDEAQNGRIARLSEAFGNICQELAVPYLNVFATLSMSELWRHQVRAGDGSHPGAAGYTLLAELVQRWSSWKSWLASA